MSEVQFLDLTPARIAYRQSSGTGHPLLMIHGNSTCHEVFRNQVEGAVGSKFRCIAFDLPGHGMSGDAHDVDRTYNMQGYAETAIELMRELEIDRYAVLGWSLGGHIALEMLAHTKALSGLMITGSPPVGQETESIGDGFNGDIEHSIASKRILSEEEIDIFAHNTCGPDAPYDPFLEKAVRRTDGRARSLMVAKLACGVGPSQLILALNSYAPLAIVNGAEDAFIHNDFIDALPYENLWEGIVHNLEGVGHAPFWETPEIFDAYLLRFLNDVT